MKIGVISDTHIPASAEALPQKVYDNFKDCDLIVHAGDIGSIGVINELNSIARTIAVYGNMDPPEVRERLQEKIIVEFAGKKIGVVHGTGRGSQVFGGVRKVFKQKLDIVIFGHSHSPVNEKINGTLFFNPGSPTDIIYSPKCSFGIIEINGQQITGQIIEC